MWAAYFVLSYLLEILRISFRFKFNEIKPKLKSPASVILKGKVEGLPKLNTFASSVFQNILEIGKRKQKNPQNL